MDIKNLLDKLSLIIFILAIPIYSYLVLSPNINDAVFNLNKVSGVDLSNSIIIAENRDIGIHVLNSIYFDTYQFFFLFTFVIGIIGVLVMYKGRSLAEVILLYLFLVIPKQRKYWGIIYDEDTNKPLSLSLIRIYSYGGEVNRLILQQVSDLDGKYRIDLPNLTKNEKYLVVVKAKGYEDFKKEITSGDQNIIHGQFFDDIAMHRIGEQKDSISFFTNFLINLRPKIYEYILYIISAASFVSFLRSIYGFYLNPTIVFILLLVMYCYIFVWNIYVIWERKSSRIGRILDSRTLQPINGVKLEIQRNQFDSAISDTNGNIKFAKVGRKEVVKVTNMPTYKIKNTDENGSIVVQFNEDGFMSSDIFLERIKPENISKSPFSK